VPEPGCPSLGPLGSERAGRAGCSARCRPSTGRRPRRRGPLATVSHHSWVASHLRRRLEGSTARLVACKLTADARLFRPGRSRICPESPLAPRTLRRAVGRPRAVPARPRSRTRHETNSPARPTTLLPMVAMSATRPVHGCQPGSPRSRGRGAKEPLPWSPRATVNSQRCWPARARAVQGTTGTTTSRSFQAVRPLSRASVSPPHQILIDGPSATSAHSAVNN